MAYSYSFDDESPRFALNSLWFLLGVMIFAFSVLVMTAIVSGGQDRGYYLNVSQPAAQETKPAIVTSRNSVAPAEPERRTR
jgi:hypothetical protein